MAGFEYIRAKHALFVIPKQVLWKLFVVKAVAEIFKIELESNKADAEIVVEVFEKCTEKVMAYEKFTE